MAIHYKPARTKRRSGSDQNQNESEDLESSESEPENDANNETEGVDEEWCPDFEYPGMPTVDYLKVKLPGPGLYNLIFGNKHAWFRSLTLHYRVLFLDNKGQVIDTSHADE